MADQKWQCPECKAGYSSPVKVSAVSCGNRSQHASGKPVEMAVKP